MDQIRIRGGNRLHGTIRVSGAKNAALPLMAASLLTNDILTLTNLPNLADIETMASLLRQLGVKITTDATSANGAGLTMSFEASGINETTAPYDLVRQMRASVLVLAPLVTRFGEATVSMPGGCAIGTRPIDLHLRGLDQLGANIELSEGYVRASAPNGLTGAEIVFPSVSVGATENLLMAACLARGKTNLVNAAREPEVNDLAHCLIAMGADISGIGTDTLQIRGVECLRAACHEVVTDRIEAGTYAIAAAITGGEVELIGARLGHLASVQEKLFESGITLTATHGGIRVSAGNQRSIGVDVTTKPYPGFPTDLQAQIMALMTTSSGAAMITETIFENRFMHVPELARMGADINVAGASAMVRGVECLAGAEVMATDLRASSSLVLAGLSAKGETLVNRVYHLDRGYERIEHKLAACGADIERITL